MPVALCAGALVYSALTDYELGLARVIPMPTHLLLDGLSGAFLAVTPWLLGFADYVWAPHLVVGLAELGVVMLSQTRPADRLVARK
jgi:hypothetical protein